jgi:hypothetical protein
VETVKMKMATWDKVMVGLRKGHSKHKGGLILMSWIKGKQRVKSKGKRMIHSGGWNFQAESMFHGFSDCCNHQVRH